MTCKLYLSVAFILMSNFLNAQCTVLPAAIAGPLTLQCPGGNNNRSAVVYIPQFNQYYCVDPGNPSFTMEAFSSTGTMLTSIAASHDYRGMWWNDSTQQLEGNSFSGGGIIAQNLDATGLPLGTITTIFATNTQPDVQSCAVFDPVNNWILYYFNGSIHRYDRYTNSFAGSLAITGIPGGMGSVNTTSLIYTGCPGIEIGLYDFATSKVYFVDQTTGAYVSQSQLPVLYVSNDRFRFAFANNILFVFDPMLLKWNSYYIFQPSGIDENEKINVQVFPNPAADYVTFTFSRFMNNASIEIADINGKTVKQINEVSGDNYKLTTEELAAGMYFYSLSANDSRFALHGKILLK